MSGKRETWEKIAEEMTEEMKRKYAGNCMREEDWKKIKQIIKQYGINLSNEKVSREDIKTIKVVTEELIQRRVNEKRQEERKEERRGKLRKMGLGVAVGAIGVAAVTGQILDNGKESPEQETKAHKEQPAIEQQDQNEMSEVEEENLVLENIAEMFNEQNPETPIEAEELGIIKYSPEHLIKQENEDGSITYINNIKATGENLAENQKFIYKSEGIGDKEETYRADKFYTVVNKKDKTIVITLADINDYIQEVETPFVQVRKENERNQEYVATDKNFHLNLEGIEGANMYIDLAHKYEEINTKLEKEEKESQDLLAMNDGEER